MSASAASRPKSGPVNVHEPGDYPIILGDSLKDTNRSQSKYTQVRYNWEPKNGFHRQEGSLKQNEGDLRLTYQDKDDSSPIYTYNGFVSQSINSKEDSSVSRLVLVFDESRSAFVLERITTSIDMNVTSAPNQTKDDIRRHRQLRRTTSEEDVNGSSRGKDAHNKDDDVADPDNPYDFRHFLAEAKENAEKGTQAGNRTPIPGGGTPISRVASPSLAAGKFASTSTFRPTPTSAPIQKRRPAENGFKPSTSSTAKKPIPPKRKDATTVKQPLSKERVSDSDDETSDTATVDRPAQKGHTRNAASTSSYAQSPKIVVEDADDADDIDDELEVEMDVPPPTRKSRGGIDPKVFGSRPMTPIQSTKSTTNTNTQSRKPLQQPKSSSRSRPSDGDDIIMPDASESDSEPLQQTRHNQRPSPSSSSDHDVDNLILPSPHHAKHDSNSHSNPPAPLPLPTSNLTPQPQQQEDEDEDDNDELERLMNEALEEEEEEEQVQGRNGSGSGVGGGAGYGTVLVDDDESEVSEEE